jgi:fatty-acyl-CoA synthase
MYARHCDKRLRVPFPLLRMSGAEKEPDSMALVPTPTEDALPRRFADFDTLGEALDYAATGVRGLNFHDARGKLALAVSLRRTSPRCDRQCAHRLIAHGIKPGDRIALVAETGADFAALFFGAVYAGAWPVPLPLPTSFGGKRSYIDQLVVQLDQLRPLLFLFPRELAEMAGSGRRRCASKAIDYRGLRRARSCALSPLPQPQTDEIAYLQYSSGSTRFPHGVAVTHARAAQQSGGALVTAWKCGQRSLHLVAALVS